MGSRQRGHVIRLVRYGRASLVCTALSMTGLAILVGGAHVPASWANAGIVLMLTPVSFELNRRWVWPAVARRAAGHILPFFAFSLAGLAGSTLAVHIASHLTSRWHTGPRTTAVELASLVAFGGLWLVQYVVLDRVVFSHGQP